MRNTGPGGSRLGNPSVAEAEVLLAGLDAVVLMCGPAGSGKTTFATALEQRGHLRLSLDENVWRRHGRPGVDFPRERYPAILDGERERLLSDLKKAMAVTSRIVVDASFWSSAHRATFRRAVEAAGLTCLVVYLHATEALLWSRLSLRNISAGSRADAPFAIGMAELHALIASFEIPETGEALVVDVA